MDELKIFCIFGAFGVLIVGLGASYETYSKNNVKIEAIKAGLVQDPHGNWIKNKELECQNN